MVEQRKALRFISCEDHGGKLIASLRHTVKKTLREKYPNTEIFLVRIFLFSVQI